MKFGPYSPIKQAGNLFFVAGQVGVYKDTNAPEKFEDQFELVIENLKQVLELEGLSLGDVVNVRVYLTDIANFVELNHLFEIYFNGISPSRECVEVSALPPVAKNGVKLKVEMSAVAIKKL
jgi:2-iminobutanoate/2-iminopropanoate deaminase